MVCEHPASHIDLVPTILAAFGVESPPGVLPGRSMLPTLLDPTKRHADVAFVEFGRYEVDHDGFGGFQPMGAAFAGRYKLAINLLGTDELYDLSADPNETTNLITSPAHAPARCALHDKTLNWMNDTRDPFRGYWWERRPWRTDARPATWDYTAMTRQREPDVGERRRLDYGTGLEMAAAVRSKK